MSRTYYLVIDDDCRPTLHLVKPETERPECPACPVCPPCPPVTPPVEPFPPLPFPPEPTPPVEPVPPIGTFPTGRVVTNGGNLNVRREPSLQGEIIGRLPHWTRVIILDQSTPGWYRISSNGTQGYVSSQWVLLDR